MEIPLVVALWDGKKFSGHKRTFVTDRTNLGITGFGDTASSIGVHPGPDWTPELDPSVSLFEHRDWGGKELVLRAGVYPDLRDYGFDDMISSIAFGPATQGRPSGLYQKGQLVMPIAPVEAAPTISPIPVVANLNDAMDLVEPCDDLEAVFGWTTNMGPLEVWHGSPPPTHHYAVFGRFHGASDSFPPGSYTVPTAQACHTERLIFHQQCPQGSQPPSAIPCDPYRITGWKYIQVCESDPIKFFDVQPWDVKIDTATIAQSWIEAWEARTS